MLSVRKHLKLKVTLLILWNILILIKKEIYLYNEEDADIDITVNSTAGDITKATVKSGSGQFLLKSKRDAVKAGTKPQTC